MFLSFGFHPLASRAATFPQLPSLLSVSMSMVVAVFLAGECLLLSLLSEDDFTFDDDMLVWAISTDDDGGEFPKQVASSGPLFTFLVSRLPLPLLQHASQKL